MAPPLVVSLYRLFGYPKYHGGIAEPNDITHSEALDPYAFT
jgi:hypothetical protein